MFFAMRRVLAASLLDAVPEGAVLRVRPKALTVAVILAGLFPITWHRHGVRSYSAHRRAEGGRHEHRAAALHVRFAGRVFPHAGTRAAVKQA